MRRIRAIQRRRKGQAILEYILMVVMLAVVVATTMRASTRTIYRYWTGLANVVSVGCPDCNPREAPPDIE